MHIRYGNKKVRELFEIETNDSVSKYRISKDVIEKYKLKITQLKGAPQLSTLSQIRSMNLEKLKGDRKGQYSIRVDMQYRICFTTIDKREVTIEILELTDYH